MEKVEPAFPLDVRGQGVHFGLSKRELFVAMAMQGLLSRVDLIPDIEHRPTHVDLRMVGKNAVRFADAVLAELKMDSEAKEKA